jgi:asparagine synthase (glutamine-hydrolysing)
VKGFYCIYGNRFSSENKIEDILWKDNPFLWVEGYQQNEIISWKDGAYYRLVIGDVLTTLNECKEVDKDYRKRQDLSVWAKLAGNTTVILSEDQKTIFLPDLCQLRPIFYVINSKGILVSTSRLWMQQMTQAPINDKSIAMSLICAGMTELSHHFSLFDKINIVPPHHVLIVQPTGVKLVPVVFSENENLTLDEGASELRFHLIDSMKRRLNKYSNLSFDFSGGLDSTSIALLATRYSKNKVDGITFSSLNEKEDVEIALNTANSTCQLRHHLLHRKDLPLPYSQLVEAPLLDEPLSFLFMWSQIEKGLKYTRSISSDLHITGDGGDNVLLASDVYVSALFHWDTLPLFFSHSLKWARKRNQSPLSQMINALQFRFMSYSSWLNNQIQQLSSTSNTGFILNWSGALFRGDWITKEAKEWVNTTLQAEAKKLKPIHPSSSVHSNWTSLFHTSSVARLTQQLGESLDVKIQFPYLDQSIVQTCFRVNSHDRSHPKRFKPLLKEALKDILPIVLLNRTSKGNYTPDLFHGFQQHYHEIHDLFCDSILAKSGIIDLRSFYQEMEKMRTGIDVKLWELNMTIAMELWLQQVKRRCI